MKEMHPCAEYQEQLSAAQGEQRAQLPEGLLAHLEDCANCVAFQKALLELPALFEPLRQLQPPGVLLERILARVPKSGWSTSRVWGLRVAAGLIGFLVVSSLVERRSARPTTPTDRRATQELFSQIERNLGGNPELAITPELELLAHLSSHGGTK